MENGSLALTENSIFLSSGRIEHSVAPAWFGVLIKMGGDVFLKKNLTTLICLCDWLGYGGAETLMIMGLPLLTTLIGMIQNIGDELVAEALKLSPPIPLGISVERLTFLVPHCLTVTMLIFQVI